jgi:hypothetical protein
VGIRSWWDKLQRRDDEAAIERIEESQVETPAERHVSSGGVDGLQADERTARLAGDASIEDVDRLGDAE